MKPVWLFLFIVDMMMLTWKFGCFWTCVLNLSNLSVVRSEIFWPGYRDAQKKKR
ncbi:hypothetical protein HanOQP8_Chr07g0254261 [Helianthus annuus]|nr:hypothetical protein HanOQP8_Chr07g0254261 [Helianthus annuus]